MHDITDDVNNLISAMGSIVTIHTVSGQVYKSYAIVQPLLYKNKMYIELPSDEIGRVDDGGYLYIGKVNCDIEPDDKIVFKGRTLVVQRSEIIYLFGDPLYYWATLRPAYEKYFDDEDEEGEEGTGGDTV